ncbi:MAG: hypothetical protein R6V49_07860 [Bacteroidales bacterium]
MRTPNKIFTGSNRVADLLSLLTALYIAKASFPLFNWLWLGTLAIAILAAVAIILTHRPVFTDSGPTKLHVYFPLGLVLLFFLLAILRSDFNTWAFKEELINLGMIILLICMQITLLPTHQILIRYRNNFFRALFYLISFVSLAGLAKFWFYLRGMEIPSMFQREQMALGTSMVLNTDQFIAAIVAAMIGVMLFKFRQKNGLLMDILYHASFLIMFYTVIWSGSKKGLLIMILLFFSVILLRIYFLVHKSRAHNYNLIRNLNVIILVIGFSAILGTWAINFVKAEKKEQWIAELGFDSYHFKSEMTMITFAHLSTFYQQADLQRWYDRLWGKHPVDHQAMKDRIAFVLVEQENIAVNDDPGSWTFKAYEYRRERWGTTLDLYKGYSRETRLFGAGFAYLGTHWPGTFSEPEPESVQFRNNFLVSTLMYSGLAGLLTLLWLLVQVGFIYYRHRKELLAMMVIFGVMVSLYLLSYNSILTNPILLVALVIPLRFGVIKTQNQAEESG